MDTEVYYLLPLFLVMVPMVAGIVLFFLAEEKMLLRGVISLGAVSFSLAGVASLLPLVFRARVCCDLIEFMQYGLSFSIDLVSWIFATLASLIWFLSTLYSFCYMKEERNLRRFYSVMTFTLGSMLGVFFAADFLTLFIFFEVMTFSSFVLVIHKQNREALQAGSLYIYMAVAGGLSLLFAILLLFGSTGSLLITPMFEQMGGQSTVILVLFMVGFGIKAGLVPLHIWLPLAHPVAPSPASALLSGIMIKAGAYGILRVTMVLFRPEGTAEAWTYLSNSGFVLIWVGIVTMLSGALMALLHSNAKRILAYSSISQMGFILTGLGVAAFMGSAGAMGYSGGIYHIINHAIFKAGLFAMIGAVYLVTHEVELQRLGGMARKLPFVTATFLIAALGIAGIPGFNGYSGKTLIHDALLEAYKYHGYYSLYLAERFFVLTSALTICYFLKLFRGVFLGNVPDKLQRNYYLPFSINLALGIFAILILGIGLLPNFLLDNLILPSAGLLGFSPESVAYLEGFHFFSWHPLQAILVVLLLAFFIYLPAISRNWFDWEPPEWLSLHNLIFRPLPRIMLSFFFREVNINDMALGQFYEHAGADVLQSKYFLSDLEEIPDHSHDEAGQSAYYMTGKGLDRDRRLREKFRGAFLWNSDQWTIKNLNFDNLLLAFVLGVILIIIFSYGG